MFYALFIFLLVNVSKGLRVELSEGIQKSSDSVLCRNCGSEILKTDSIISKLSPASLNTFNDTVFNKDAILVQLLAKDFIQIPLITSEYSACVRLGEWEYNDDWFPGYRWKHCVCSQCGAVLGYKFPRKVSGSLESTMATAGLSKEDLEYLASLEEEFKDHFTENDEEFMKVHNAEPSIPPIVEKWWTHNNSGRRNNRRNNRRHNFYDRPNRGRGGYHDRRDNYDSRGYNDYRQDRGYNNYRQNNRY